MFLRYPLRCSGKSVSHHSKKDNGLKRLLLTKTLLPPPCKSVPSNRTPRRFLPACSRTFYPGSASSKSRPAGGGTGRPSCPCRKRLRNLDRSRCR